MPSVSLQAANPPALTQMPTLEPKSWKKKKLKLNNLETLSQAPASNFHWEANEAYRCHRGYKSNAKGIRYPDPINYNKFWSTLLGFFFLWGRK